MSTAIKNNRLSSEDKTAEFELGDFTKKGTVVPPSPAIQQKVQTLRTETKEIKQQIDQVKTEASVRKEDESTRVFNLRQAQLVQKIKDLELKKQQTEKTIQKMLEEKSNDLAKTSKNIDDLSEGMIKLNSIKNELANFFEQATNERKKNSEAIVSHGVELQNLQKLLHQCHEFLTKEYAQLSNVIRPLADERIDLEKAVIHLKTEYARVEAEIKGLESRKFTLDMSAAEVERHLETKKEQEGHQNQLLHSLYQKVEDAKKDVEAHQEKYLTLVQTKETLQVEINDLKEQFESMNKNGESLKWSLVALNEQHDQKKSSLVRADQDMVDLKKRIEDLRNKEAELIKSCGHYTTNLNHLQGEVAGLEASRAAALKMQEEAMEFLKERREFYNQHVQDLEYTHKAKIGLLEKDYLDQKAEWDKNFAALEEQQRESLEAKLEEHTVKYHAVLRESQNVLMDDVIKVVKRHLTRTVFESGQQRAELAQDELAPILKNYFNQTVTMKTKFWQSWKLWLYCTTGLSVVSLGLIAKLLWF